MCCRQSMLLDISTESIGRFVKPPQRFAPCDCSYPRPQTNQKATRRWPFVFVGWGSGIDSAHPWSSPSLRSGRFALQNGNPAILSNPVSLRLTGVLTPRPQAKNEKAARWAASHFLAGGEGFEPPLAESESAVLPLDDPPVVYEYL